MIEGSVLLLETPNKTKSCSSEGNSISSKPRLSFNLIYNLEAVAALLKFFVGLVLVHFQKYWLLRKIHTRNKVFVVHSTIYSFGPPKSGSDSNYLEQLFKGWI